MNVLVVSESFMVKESLSNLFKNNFEEIDLEIISYLNEFEQDSISHIDFLLIDAKEGNIENIEFINKAKNLCTNMKIMILDCYKTQSLFLEAIKIGVDAYIVNISDKEEFMYVLKKVISGKKFYDAELLRSIVDKPVVSTEVKLLTHREKDVLSQVCKGFSNKDIAQSLEVTEYTIKKHVSSILNKLNLKNRKDIIIYAKDNKILDNIG